MSPLRHRSRRHSRPTIGMLTSSLTDLYQVQWLGAVDAARAMQANLVCFIGRELDDPRDYAAQANAIYDLVSDDQFDGLIIWTTTLQLFVGQQRMEEFCRRFRPLPIVSVEQVLAGSPSLLMDNRQGMYEGVNHLIEVHGHRRIAFVRGPGNHPGAEERYRGYLDALASHHLASDPGLVSPRPRSWNAEEAGAWAASLVVDAPARVEAIAASNDDLALGVLSALEHHHVRLPDDVAVVGFDDAMNIIHHDLGFEAPSRELPEDALLERAVNVSATTLPLTTVRPPFYQLGWRSVEMLLGQLRGEPMPDVVTIPTKLIVRRSCGCLSPALQQAAPRSIAPPSTASSSAGAVLPASAAGSVASSREEATAQMKQALAASEDVRPADWAECLTTAFMDALRSGSPDAVLVLIDALLRASLRTGESLEAWWRALYALRRQALPDLTSAEILTSAEDLWLRVQLLMEEAAERLFNYRQLLSEKRDQIMREVGQRLITAPDVDQLAETLAHELPRVGIPSCYLAAYASQPGDPDPAAWSRALLVYERGGRCDVSEAEVVFRSRELVPGLRLRRARPYSMVAAPLYFKDRRLGFVLFEVGPRFGWMYQALQEQLSSAIQGALLVEREREALAAVEEARRLLEERVAERTAELAETNETLIEQIIERERSEEARANLEAQLRHAQKMEALGRLAGGVAHDFNNLLVVITGYSHLLLGYLRPDDPMRNDIEQIRLAGDRAAALTRQLLAFGRKQVLQPHVLSLNSVVTNVETMLRRLIGEDVELATNLDPSLALIRADPGQIEQVIVNLAVNARDAMPGGGRMTIETANAYLDQEYARQNVGVIAGPYVMLSVSDTGVGIDATTRARLFEPFFTTKPQGEGTGLGLATVFGIVQQSGGHIQVSSAPDRGATFRIYLPRSAQATQEAEADDTRPRSSDTGSDDPRRGGRSGSATGHPPIPGGQRVPRAGSVPRR